MLFTDYERIHLNIVVIVCIPLTLFIVYMELTVLLFEVNGK